MVNITKIVLKSQTRLTLNERFTQFGEQQEARLQMLKNDLHTRIVEESFQNGTSHGAAELSEKLDRLARGIENFDKHQDQKKRRSKESSRTHENHEVHEEPIVPSYRPLLYRSERRRNDRVRKHSSNSKRPVTYGDVLSSDSVGEGEVSHWRAEALRGVRTAVGSYRNAQKYSNPLMRDSDDETSESTSAAASSGVSVHSRLGLKQTSRPRNQIHKNRSGPGKYRKKAFDNRGSGNSGGSSGSRQAVTKEDLDRELDEYRQKGSVIDVEMGED